MARIRVRPSSSESIPATNFPRSDQSKPRWHVLGFVYLGVSLVLSIVYIQTVVKRSVTNDFYWAGFNATGVQTYLGDIFNAKVPLFQATKTTLAVGSSLATFKSYAAANTFIDANPSAARAAMLSIPLAQAVVALRNASFAANIAMSPFCWVDLTRQFGVAVSAARQHRCEQGSSDNAAVYFEIPLRNSNIHASHWFDYFNTTLFQPLGTTDAGRRWLDASATHLRLPTDDEVHVWREAGVNRWTTPMHNAWQIGMQQTISIVNALGLTYQVDVNTVPFSSLTIWTTSRSWIGFGNIAYLCAFYECSVVRGLPNSIDQMPFDWDVDVVVGPVFTTATTLVRETIGPYGVFDIRMVSPPNLLVQAVRTVQDYVVPALQLSIMRPLDTIEVDPIPFSWTGLLYYGGNPMCLHGTAQSFVQPSFSFDDSCGTPLVHTISVGGLSSLFAIMASGWASFGMLSSSVCSLCGSETTQTMCVEALQSSIAIYQNLAHPPSLSPNVIATILPLNVSIIQFATTANSTPVLLVQPMVSTSPQDATWSFFGWITMYEWALGYREVYTFDGDVGSVTTISPRQPFIQQPANPLELPENACYYIWYIVVYVTFVLTGVGAIVLALATWHAFQMNGAALFCFNRVVGSVWIGRTFLLLRGMLAIVILSTANVAFVSPHGFSQLQLEPREWFDICLLAGETIWLSYAVTDLVLPSAIPSMHAPCSAIIAWLITVAWEVTAPTEPIIELEPSCIVTTIGMIIQCRGGTVTIGNYKHLQGLVLLQIVCLGGSILVTQVVARRSKTNLRHAVRHLILPAASDAFLVDQRADLIRLDRLSCVMSGMIPSSQWLFDLKLWGSTDINLDPDTDAYVLHPPTFDRIEVESPSQPTFQYIKLSAMVGLGYIVATVVGSFLFLSLTQSTMANDFWWDSFNSTGAQSYLINWYNVNLQTSQRTAPFRMDEVAHGDSTEVYNTSDTNFLSSALYATALQNEANTLSQVITGLRKMDGCQVPWIFTPYCFVDFSHQWEMANSASRQVRCYAQETSNGAVYLETMLRNADGASLRQCWGQALDAGIFATLGQSTMGQAWMTSVQTNTLPVAEEVTFWLSNGISFYTTQWQTFKLLGVVENIWIQNAFGIPYSLTLKRSNSTMQVPAQTTYKMYWGLANDLLAIGGTNVSSIAGLSLIRNSDRFAFQNTSLESVLVESDVLTSPLAAGLTLVRATLGPFGSIDIKRVATPPSLKVFYRALTTTVNMVLSGLNESRQWNYRQIPSSTVFTVAPVAWDGVLRVSGDLFCEFVPHTANDISEFFLPQGICGVLVLNALYTTRENMLKALLATNFVDTLQLNDVCAREHRNPQACLQAITMLWPLLQHVQAASFTAMALAAKHEIGSTVQVQVVQFITSEHGGLNLSRVNVFDPTEVAYELWAWLYLFDWVEGNREVISVQGSLDTLVTISGFMSPVETVPNALEIPVNVAYYIRCAIQYVTILLLVVAGFVVVYIFAVVGLIDMWNMMEFNRVAGVVWVGRPLMLLRGITAICLLSTARLELIQSDNGLLAYFASPTRPFYTVLMSGGEMCWLVYILNDTFSPLTRQHTFGYATKSSLLTWLITFLWSLASPVQHQVTISRHCTVDSVDFQLVCSSGTMEIGSIARFGGLIGLAVGCCVVSYILERLMYPHTQYHQPDQSLMLHATARNCLDFERWHHRGVFYIDQASAVLTGLLAIQRGHQIFIFDIKSWRRYTINMSTLRGSSFKELYEKKHLVRAIPLVE
ncbi:Aste57867_9758 [Aphanomyces stellatus]|uniref:Aste57867_9758 protein n=1 Tax=Aphanomyces stellatus TaxID=120398 RepID=A0A485KP92_9STRA|nr:hypothetical protein As57867_009719 [Aphanomyces stellatus]VFT86637.1 Aste57867_9758 [Aphanomyces stellatus]